MTRFIRDEQPSNPTWSSLALALALVAGCGHPATRDDCAAIFDKSAELELRAQNITDGAEIDRRVAEARAQKPELLDECIGKRITDKALQCVRDATSTETFDACLQ
jgi:hypothetical protein